MQNPIRRRDLALWIIGALLLIGSLVAAYAVTVNPETHVGNIPLLVLGVLSLTYVFILSSWEATRIIALRRLTGAFVSATKSLPWDREQIEAMATGLIAANVSAEYIGIQDYPGMPPAINAQVADDKWLVVLRKKGGVFRKRVADEQVILGIAEMARTSYLRTATEAELRNEAETDTLTGLPNFQSWQASLIGQSRERRPGELIGVVFFDIDFFKLLNETYGHMRADIVLAVTGQRLRLFSANWEFGRFGGDEFVGVRRNLRSAEQLDSECAKIRKALRQPVLADGKEITTDITIGRIISASASDEINQIIRRAEADERSRKADRPAVVAAQTDGAVTEALLSGALDVHYQPIYRLPDRVLVGWEALLRAEIPGRGKVPITELISASLAMGALDQVTIKLAESAIETVGEASRRAGQRLFVSINLEFQQFRKGNPTVKYLLELAAGAECDIIVEVTERDNIEWLPRHFELVKKLERSGIQVWLDDIGIGDSRLRALAVRRWPCVKFSNEFLNTGPDGIVLLEYTLAALHKLGQPVLLEGLETEGQVEFAEKLGVEYGQGYWLSHPMPSEDLFATLDDKLRLSPSRAS